jgi:HrpA-like RNA helicase
MSATLDAKQFSSFWRNAPVGVVHGRSYPVSIFHTIEPQVDYVEAAIHCIIQIHMEEESGDILCFLTGQDEIEDARRVLLSRMKLLPNSVSEFTVMTLYSAMPYELQLKVFEPLPNNSRKVILATNIAETSITVEGIKYVVDSGVVKAKFFNHATGLESLNEIDVSKAQATQRAGRAGRVAAGKCYRLYTAEAFESLAEKTTPEIMRCSMCSVVLQMKFLGVADVSAFEFMDKPPLTSILKAEESLRVLGALDRNLAITPLGRRLIDFPVEPSAAKVLIVGKILGIPQDVVGVIAFTSTENVIDTTYEGRTRSDRCREQYGHTCGDHATYLGLFAAYKNQPRKLRQQWCESNGINFRQMQKVEDTAQQLGMILDRGGEREDPEVCKQVNADSCTTGKRDRDDGHITDEHQKNFRRPLRDFELLRRALCFGYFQNAAYFDAKLGQYKTVVGDQVVHIHPSSVLFPLRRKPSLVVFHNVVQTSKKFMKEITVVHEEWLLKAAPDFYRPVL